MELDELRNPQRVAHRGAEMGMVIPTAPVFLDLETGKTTGVRTPATRENAIQLQPPAPIKPAILAPEPTYVEVPAAPTVEEQAATDPGVANAKPRKNRNR